MLFLLHSVRHAISYLLMDSHRSISCKLTECCSTEWLNLLSVWPVYKSFHAAAPSILGKWSCLEARGRYVRIGRLQGSKELQRQCKTDMSRGVTSYSFYLWWTICRSLGPAAITRSELAAMGHCYILYKAPRSVISWRDGTLMVITPIAAQRFVCSD